MHTNRAPREEDPHRHHPGGPASDSVDEHAGPADIVPIVAMAYERVIGFQNRLPWRIPEDLRRFKATTMGHPVVMGRRTFESIGKPLPGRANIVVTRQQGYAGPSDVHLASSPQEAFRIGAGLAKRVFVIGGAQLYAAALGHAREILATFVYHGFPGDAFFPALDAAWHVASREDFESRESSLRPEPLYGSFVALVRSQPEDGCALCRVRASLEPLPRARQGESSPWDTGFARLVAALAQAPSAD